MTTGLNIVVVEDHDILREILVDLLCQNGHRASGFFCAEDVDDEQKHALTDLYVIDLNLPGEDGLSICRRIRAESMVPIIMLSAKSDSYDVVLGLEAGADDYIVKPFKHPSELVARIRTRLRRTNTDISGLLTIGDLAIDVTAHQVLRAGKQIALTRLEFDLLVALAKEPGRVFSRDALLTEVWGYRHSTDTRLVNVHVQRLRAKIEHDAERPEIVVTIRGVGYKAGVMGGS